jgi:hypothetical protein
MAVCKSAASDGPIKVESCLTRRPASSNDIEVYNTSVLPPGLHREASAGIKSKVNIINHSQTFVCLAWIDENGNLVHGTINGPFTTFYVAPNGKTPGNGFYCPNTKDIFVILTIRGDILGYCVLKHAGEFNLTVESF